jgi:hypothetical protein
LRLHLLIWAQESILVKPPDLGLLPSGSELFPWRILMPHLHPRIIKGNRSPTLQSNKLILGKIWRRDKRKIVKTKYTGKVCPNG